MHKTKINDGTNEFAYGTNMPSEMTPSKGPPSKPNKLRANCKTVLPKY